MNIQLPTTEPTQFRAGTTVAWQKTEFPVYTYAEGYTIATYTINGKYGTATIQGTYNAGVWTFILNAASNTLPQGTYRLYGYVETSGSGRQTVYDGELNVQASLVTAAQIDTRSHVKKTLDAIKALLEGRATKMQESAQLPNGTSLSLLPPSELIKWHSHYEYLYKQELETERVSSGKSRRLILPRFNPTS